MRSTIQLALRLPALLLAATLAASCARPAPGAPDAPDAPGTARGLEAPRPPRGEVVVIPPLPVPAPDPAPPESLGVERGLDFRLREVAGGTPAVTPPRPGAGAGTATLPAERIAALLRSLPALPVEERDSFRFPPRSPPPPRTGAVIREPFPPLEASPPPRPDSAPAAEPLRVLRVTPTGPTQLAPELTLTFSQPMVALTTVSALDASQIPVRLTPQPAGRWSWVDARTLRFEPTGRFPMATRFRVEVPAGTRAVTGAALAEPFRAEFTTSPARAVGAYPNRGGPAPTVGIPAPRARVAAPVLYDVQAVTDLDPLVVLVFDQRVDPAAVLRSLELTAGGAERPLRLATAVEIAADPIVRRQVAAAEEGRWVVVRPASDLPRDAEVTVALLSGAASAEGPETTTVTQELYFRTYGPLRVVSSDCVGPDEASCFPGAPWSIALTNPIDTAGWSPEYVRVDPGVADLHVRVIGGRILLQGETRARTLYRVTLDPRIRDRFAQPLGEAAPIAFQVADAPPMLTFPGAPFIVVDPAGPPRVLVHSRGHDSIRVRIHRVGPEDWEAYSEAIRDFRGSADGAEIRLPGTRVVDRAIDPAGARGDFAETAVDVSPALTNGLGHAIVVISPSAEEPAAGGRGRVSGLPTIAWVQATRIGLAAMADESELTAWATSLANGAPLAGVQLELLPSGATARTDASGLGTLRLSQEEARVLIARQGADVAMLPDNPYGGYGEGWTARGMGAELRWLVFSDRGLYRPGESVRLKGWIRRADLAEGGGLAVPSGSSAVRYTVTGPRQEQIDSGRVAAGSLGGFDAAFELPAETNLGGAQILLRASGAGVPRQGSESYHSVAVQEFRRPEYEVSVEAPAGPHLVRGIIPASVRAAYYSGGGLAAARVQWRATSSPGHFTPPGWEGWSFGRPDFWWDQGGQTRQEMLEGVTGPSGEHRLDVELLGVDPPFPASLRLEAQVGDVNRQVGSGGATLLVHPAALYAGLRAERGWVHPGDSVGIEVVAVDLDGRQVAGRAVELVAERVEWRWIGRLGRQQSSAADTVPVCSVPSGAAPVRCVFRPREGGSYRLRAEVRDDVGRVSRTELLFWVAGGPMPPTPEQGDAAAVTLVADRPEYQPGDTAALLVRAPFFPAVGVVTIRQSGVTRTEEIRLDSATAELRVPIAEAQIPNFHVRVDLVDTRWGTRFAAGELQLMVPPRRRELTVRITPADSVALPGATSSIEVEVVGPDGRPAAGSEVALWMVDEAVLALGGYQLPDPLTAFYPQRFPNVRDAALRPFVMLAPRSAGPGTVSGVVLSGVTGERLGGARASVEGSELAAVSAASGGFTIEGVDPGRRTIVIEGMGVTVRRVVDVPAAGVHLGTVVLSLAGAVEREEMMAQAGGAPLPAPVAVAPTGADAAQAESAFRTDRRMDLAGAVGNVAGTGADKQGDPAVALRTEFAPLALFEPALRTGADGRVRVAVRVPESLTRYRVMAVAVSGPSRFGRGESTLTTRRDLMVRPTAPRFLNYGDRVEIPVLLQNSTDRALTVEVAARGNGIRLEDPRGQRVTVPANDRVEIRLPATADGAGTARLQIVAVAGSATDAASVSFPVYTPATAEAFATYGEIDSNAPVVLPVAVPGGVLAGFGGLEVTLSSTAVAELTDAVLYLESYPFEGAEQVASRVMAIAALRDVLAAFRAEGLPSPDSLVAAVRRDLTRLAALQAADGGWSWWRADQPSSPYLSVHVAHALQRARENGFTLPAGVMERATEYLRQRLPEQLRDSRSAPRTAILAYSIYVRDRAGDPDAPRAALALLDEERRARPLDAIPLEPAAWLLHALADVSAARSQVDELLRTIRNRATETAANATFVTRYAEGDAALVLHSARRTDAVVLEALIAADPRGDLVAKTARGLLSHRTRGRWGSTQENAWALLALQRYFREYESATPSFRSGVWLDDRFAGDHAFQGRTTGRQHLEIPMAEVLRGDSTRELTLGRTGQGRMYYRAGLRYAPADLDLDPLQRGFSVTRSYEAVDDSADVRRDPYGNWRVRAGARVRVRVTMIAPSRRDHVALVDPLPAGFEPLNPELQGTGFTDEPPAPPGTPRPLARVAAEIRPWGEWFVHQNLRDDRAEAFASELPAGRYDYSYLARATTPGTFVVPPARAEEMYEPESFGRGGTGRVIVE